MKVLSSPISSAFEFVTIGREQSKLKASSNVTRLCQKLVAQALGVESDSVHLKQCILSPSKLFLKAYGTSHRTRFFAKTYLVDVYPVEPRLEMPWKDEVSRTASARPIADQIKIEWDKSQVMRELAGHNEVARRLGMSFAARTSVWEEAPGCRVDRSIGHMRWEDPKGRSLAPAFFKAGAWLARVHKASLQGYRSLDMREVGSTIQDLVLSRGLLGSKYGTVALKIIGDSNRAIGQDSVEIPLVLTHGDYCPANLIWEGSDQRLTVVDFEYSAYRLTSHDLISFLFSLRVHLLNPWVPKEAVTTLEESFWWGYGAIPRPLYTLVNAVASAMVFYYYLPRVSTRRERRGWWAGLVASAYQALFESRMVTKRLGIPAELWDEPMSRSATRES
jgi:hypothetical protein